MPDSPNLVARMPELARLERTLNQALARHGQISFIVGEAGTGKTALAATFCREAQEKHKELVVATGVCDAQTGSGDPYLPVREVMAMLSGSVEGDRARGVLSEENSRRLRELMAVTAETIVEHGPDLIDIIVPGAALATRLGKIVAEKTELARRLQSRIAPGAGQSIGRAAVDQGEILEQCGNVLRQLSLHRPLLIVLDDLHWADNGSIDLLFRLGRRLGDSRLMVLGTFRPEEIAVGRVGVRHPLEKLRAELKRYLGEIEIDLDDTVSRRGREFVDTYLSIERNRLSDAFHTALYRHTGGHPLFTVELLRALQERGDIVQTADGYWVEGRQLDWENLPARVEGVVAERIERLPEELQQHLSVASVEGEQFTAEVVAVVREEEPRSIVRELSEELQNEHRLVESQGVQRLGRQRVSRYRFTHNLMQQYLYGHLDDVQLSYMHEDIGRALEELYGEHADTIAAQLARHFLLADMPDKARHYLRRAGQQAAGLYANAEALDFLSRALDLTPSAEMGERFEILTARERVYDLLGDREAQADDLRQLATLAHVLDQANPAGREALVAVRRSKLAVALGDLADAQAAAQEALDLAGPELDAIRAEAHMALGRAMLEQGDYRMARAEFDEALDLATKRRENSLLAAGNRHLSLALYRLGDYAAARAAATRAATLSADIGDPRGEAAAINILGAAAYALGDLGDVISYFDRALGLYRQVGARQGEGMSLINLGIMALYLGDYDAAQRRFEETVALQREIGDRNGIAISQFRLGQIANDREDYAGAVAWLEKSLALRREMGDRDGVAESLNGLAMARYELGQVEAAAELFDEALAMRRQLGQDGQALMPAVGLARARLAADPGQTETAKALAEPAVLALLEGAPDGVAEPHRLCYDCYLLLAAIGDDRATDLLAQSARWLQAAAAKINESELRQAYLEKVPANRQILATLESRSNRAAVASPPGTPAAPGRHAGGEEL